MVFKTLGNSEKCSSDDRKKGDAGDDEDDDDRLWPPTTSKSYLYHQSDERLAATRGDRPS